MKQIDYFITGVGESGRRSLIYTCGKDKEHAENTLIKVMNDEKVTSEYDEIRVDEEVSKDCWWNY